MAPLGRPKILYIVCNARLRIHNNVLYSQRAPLHVAWLEQTHGSTILGNMKHVWAIGSDTWIALSDATLKWRHQRVERPNILHIDMQGLIFQMWVSVFAVGINKIRAKRARQNTNIKKGMSNISCNNCHDYSHFWSSNFIWNCIYQNPCISSPSSTQSIRTSGIILFIIDHS